MENCLFANLFNLSGKLGADLILPAVLLLLGTYLSLFLVRDSKQRVVVAQASSSFVIAWELHARSSEQVAKGSLIVE